MRQSFALLAVLVLLANPGCDVQPAEPPSIDVVPSAPQPGEPQDESEMVLGWYAETSGRVFDRLWSARPDPALIAKSPADIVTWLNDRLSPGTSRMPRGIPLVGEGAASVHADLARAYVALSERERVLPREDGLFEARCMVLRQALSYTRRSGEGPVRALATALSRVAKERPESDTGRALYVDYYRAVSRIVEMNSWSYTLGKPIKDPAAFCGRALSEAREAEYRGLNDVYRRFEGTRAADLAAMYLARAEWDREKEGHEKAKERIEKHCANWRSDPDLWKRAVEELGGLLPSVLMELGFTDTAGRHWGPKDLQGRRTLFYFFFPSSVEALDELRSNIGPWATVIAVPVTKAPSPGTKGLTVDPVATDVHELAKVLHVERVPGMALVTPELEVISGTEQVGRYLNEHGQE